VNEQIIGKLESTVEGEKPHLSEKLTISQLSEQSGIPQKQLSQILNNYYKKNFFDYINTLRINEFNRAYKKHVGVPPSAFAKSGTSS
jgi:AraC-like DNA-binding protein